MSKLPRKFFPENRNGVAIDAVVIIANLFLFPYLLARIGNLFDASFADDAAFPTLALLMLFVLAARLGGLYLKRFPLQTRLEKKGQTSFPIYFFFLNFGVFVLNSAFVVVFLTSVVGELGLVETNYNGYPKESLALSLSGVAAMLALTGTEIYLIWRLSKPFSEKEKELRKAGDWKYGWLGEFAADFGLFAYMMIWQVFYNNTAKLFMTPAPNTPDTLELKIGGAIFLFIVFLIFYLSPRTIFLVEDRKYPGTWLFIFGVYLASVFSYG